MRVLGVDLGRKRTGLALSDPSGTLARPWRTLSGEDVLGQVAAIAAELAGEEEGLAEIVVGLPRRLDGSENEQTGRATAFAEALRPRVGVPVALQDERLTSIEAEQRLAEREKDWRRRKEKLDQVAAALILQDFLDTRPSRRGERGAPVDPAGSSRPA